MTRITEQIAHLQERIKTAADRAGRDARTVQVVAVSKKHPVAAIREAHAAGLTRFGENYLQEAAPKIAEIDLPVEWHFIGKLQSNKAGAVADSFDWVHTVAGE
ncbi:MAG: YggS family pyridoxal phosphate enzyme, partial [Gammaproteobacteria bacterium]